MATRNAYKTIGSGRCSVEIEFLGEVFANEPAPLDTTVNVSEGTLCAITWADKDAFIAELQAVITKYSI